MPKSAFHTLLEEERKLKRLRFQAGVGRLFEAKPDYKQQCCGALSVV